MSVAEINEALAGVTEYEFPAFRRGTDSALIITLPPLGAVVFRAPPNV